MSIQGVCGSTSYISFAIAERNFEDHIFSTVSSSCQISNRPYQDWKFKFQNSLSDSWDRKADINVICSLEFEN